MSGPVSHHPERRDWVGLVSVEIAQCPLKPATVPTPRMNLVHSALVWSCLLRLSRPQIVIEGLLCLSQLLCLGIASCRKPRINLSLLFVSAAWIQQFKVQPASRCLVAPDLPTWLASGLPPGFPDMHQCGTYCVYLDCLPVTCPVCLSLLFLKLRLVENKINKGSPPFSGALAVYQALCQILYVPHVI